MPTEDYPRTWSEMSFESKGMFAYHVVMMVMMLAGGSLAFIEQIAIAAAIALVIAIVSGIRRIGVDGLFPVRRRGRGLQEQGLALQSGLGPWALAGLGIAVFSVLNVLRITHLSEKAFREECGEQTARAQPELPAEPRWKVITKYAFAVVFIAVWLEAVTAFYVFDRALRSGTPTPTVERTVALDNRGTTVYVAPAEKRLVDQLQGFMFIGIPTMMVTALILHFVLKVRFTGFR